jgi:hypothetical protein
VAGESLAAHHQEIADETGYHRNDAGGEEGVGHEFVGEHVSSSQFVMPGLVPGIHVFAARKGKKGVDGRDKPGHDGTERYQ